MARRPGFVSRYHVRRAALVHIPLVAGAGLLGMVGALTGQKRRFQLVLIKPSHHDDDGYVIQWMRAFVPSNTLAVLYSLGRDSGLRSVLGPDTAIDITVIDEIHTRVKIKRLLSLFRRHDGFGL